MRLISLISAAVILAAMLLAQNAFAGSKHDWYESLTVPSEGLSLPKGVSCCGHADCGPRYVHQVQPGFYAVLYQGKWLPFTKQPEITDTDILINNPNFQWTVCVVNGKVVCFVRGRVGG